MGGATQGETKITPRGTCSAFISIHAYQKMRGRLQKDDSNNDGFRNIDEAEVPQLQKHAKKHTNWQYSLAPTLMCRWPACPAPSASCGPRCSQFRMTQPDGSSMLRSAVMVHSKASLSWKGRAPAPEMSMTVKWMMTLTKLAATRIHVESKGEARDWDSVWIKNEPDV
jgi:hypothetical protein